MYARTCFFTGLLSVVLLTGCQSAADTSSPPNVIIFLADDQGWGDLSINGNQNVQTPNIDGLAEQGARFEQFYVSPVCSPTRAELLTGRYHPRSGVYSTSAGGERLDLDETTIADVFKQAGYVTGAFGKWHNGMQAPYHPNARGFDEYYGFASGHWGHYFSPMLEHNGQIVKGNGYLVDDLTDHAISFIESHKNKPFFVYLPYNTPHSPMQVPDRWWDKFKDMDLISRHREPEKEVSTHLRAALAMTENIDWNVGRVLERLEALGLDGNTIVLYMTDNGPNGARWNGGMKGRKGSTDEGGVRSPLFMRWPDGIVADTRIHQPAAAIDLLPTLTGLAGIDAETQKPLDGIDLTPVLAGTKADESDRIIFSHWRGRVSARNQQFRLDHEGQLFDMQADPGQYQNVSEQYPEVAAQMRSAKTRWEKLVLAELNPDEERPFTLGHPDYPYTQIPARDGIAHGGIERSNRYPNDSFFLNWTSLQDSITWDVDVLADGEFEVTLYYTCPEKDLGSLVALRLGDQALTARITEAHDPPLVGMDEDRDPRQESYVKDFKPMNMGRIRLTKGTGTLTLKALEIPESQVMDFRLLLFKRV